MALSYVQRVLCLAGVSMVLLQTALELLLWVGAPILLRLLQSLGVRHRERALYLIQLMPSLIALTFTAFFCVPRYVLEETNFASEGVGWAAIALASGLYAWWAARLVGGFRLALRTVRFSRACRLGSESIVIAGDRPPIVLVDGAAGRIALVGLAHPFIFISRSLMERGGLHPLALEVVFEHERSHALQLDNWKILSLFCLPRLPLKLSGGKTWLQIWRNTAEWAADQDAVKSSRERALLLAATLVALARSGSEARPQAICTYFACEESELALRVERLIDPLPEQSLPQGLRPWLAAGCAALAVTILVLSLRAALGNLPERLLHLG